MSRAKSLLKNAQRIGDCKTPDLNQEPSQDLLKRLQEYRANSFSKYASPLRNLSEKQRTHGQNLTKIAVNAAKIGSSRHYRPCTSPYPENILAAVKMIEKPVHKPNKSNIDQYYQEKSNDRLYRGARMLLGKGKSEVPDGETIEKSGEVMFTETASIEFHEFLDSIRMLYQLRFDLELNYDIVRGDAVVNQHTMLGDYFSLEEKLTELLQTGADSMKTINSAEILKVIQEYNRIVRHILMSLKLKTQNNEATLVEMLWRIVIKLFDNALILHEQSLFDLTEMAKTKTKNTIKEYKEKMSFQLNEFQVTKDDLEKKIDRLQEQVKNLQFAIADKDKYIHDRDKRMNELLEATNRDKSCLEMTRILKKLNNYISETEDQQHKQAAALSGISHVMSLAEKFDGKPETDVKETQTELSLPFNPFPELEKPRLSKSFFYDLYDKAGKSIESAFAIQYLDMALDECAGEEVFIRKYAVVLMRTFTSKADLLRHVKAAGELVIKDSSIKCRLLYRLIGLPKPLDASFEMGLLKISSCLNNIEGKSVDGLLPLHKVIEVFQLILPAYQTQLQNLLSILTCSTSFPIEIKKNLWVLLARFYFALEKTKKPLKFHLDAMDAKKEGISNALYSC
jgi:hypothetical protein